MSGNMMRDVRRRENRTLTKENANLAMEVYHALICISLHDLYGFGAKRIKELEARVSEMETKLLTDSKRNRYDYKNSTAEYAVNKIFGEYNRITKGSQNESKVQRM